MKRRSSLWGFAAALLAITSLSSETRAEVLERAPYLQSTTHDSTTIVWTSDVGAASEVRYGASPDNLSQVAAAAASVTQHEIKISNLNPNTRYYYSVGSPGNVLAGGDADHYFETNPTVGARKKFRTWIVGDSGNGSSRQRAVRDAMFSFVGAYRPHLYLHMGDIAYDTGTTSEFTNNFFGIYPTVLRNTTCWPTLGNHEGTNSDSGTQTGPYYTAYVLPKAGEAGGLPSGTEAYYSFDYANVHFIVLDSHDSPRTPAGAMLTWMQADLAATNQEWIIAFWHHPPYTKGSHDSDTEGRLIDMREYALPILEAGGVDLVLAGHSHIYERSYLIDGAYDTPTMAPGHIVDSGDGKPLGNGPYVKSAGNVAHQGTVYVVAGHGGASVSGSADHPVMYFSEVDHGSCILDIQENRLSLVNIRWDGALTDRFALVKGTGIVIAAPDGGETLQKGTTYDIQWATVGSIPNVKIEYSIDDGKTYSTIVASTPNTGTHAWTVPAVDTAKALVRVSNAANEAVFDESNAGFTMAASAPVEVITLGSEWKYHDDGTDQGSAWLDVAFDDAAWKSGKGQFGYGEGDEATTLIDESPNHPSAYFRKKIVVNGDVTKADLTVLHDDGVVVWVNGVQVFSEYVGDTSYGAFASGQSQDNEVDNASISLAPNPFVMGENVIAAMVKQISQSSSDLSFDLSLTLTTAVPNASSGSGASGGAGGNPGTGGAGVGGNGQGGANAGGNGPSGETGTCGCRIVGESGSAAVWSALGFLCVAWLRRRRNAAI
ncbi:MAG: metallophosphoesterase [Polyangiaceae bacterium]|nr:metallophosphoesterase [Polyangiaceae bacterium]